VEQTKVMVLDGSQRAALAITRSLGRRGIEVFSGASVAKTICSTSRYCKGSFVYTAPSISIKSFLDDIRRAVSRIGPDYVVPVTDETVLVLSKYGIEYGIRTLGCPTYERYHSASDKYDIALLANEVGLIAPRGMLVDGKTDFASLRSFCYPLVLKPRWSVIEFGDRIVKEPVSIVKDLETAKRKISEIEQHGNSAIVQELVSGHGAGVFLLCKSGQTIASFCHERVREKPPWGGVSTVCKTVFLPEEIVSGAKRLMERLSWDGIAMVEFKWHPEMKTSYLMEVNARFWGSLRLACAAGLDLPYYVLCISTGRQPIIPSSIGSARLRWLLGDLDQLLITFRDKRNPIGIDYSCKHKIRKTIEFIDEMDNTFLLGEHNA